MAWMAGSSPAMTGGGNAGGRAPSGSRFRVPPYGSPGTTGERFTPPRAFGATLPLEGEGESVARSARELLHP